VTIWTGVGGNIFIKFFAFFYKKSYQIFSSKSNGLRFRMVRTTFNIFILEFLDTFDFFEIFRKKVMNIFLNFYHHYLFV